MSVPRPSPVFICPAKTVISPNFWSIANNLERQVEESFSVKEVIITESIYSVLLCKIVLLDQKISITKIVISNCVVRNMRLVMILKLWASIFYVMPLREAFAPPLVIFRDGMILREVKCDWLNHDSFTEYFSCMVAVSCRASCSYSGSLFHIESAISWR